MQQIVLDIHKPDRAPRDSLAVLPNSARKVRNIRTSTAKCFLTSEAKYEIIYILKKQVKTRGIIMLVISLYILGLIGTVTGTLAITAWIAFRIDGGWNS